MQLKTIALAISNVKRVLNIFTLRALRIDIPIHLYLLVSKYRDLITDFKGRIAVSVCYCVESDMKVEPVKYITCPFDRM